MPLLTATIQDAEAMLRALANNPQGVVSLLLIAGVVVLLIIAVAVLLLALGWAVPRLTTLINAWKAPSAPSRAPSLTTAQGVPPCLEHQCQIPRPRANSRANTKTAVQPRSTRSPAQEA